MSQSWNRDRGSTYECDDCHMTVVVPPPEHWKCPDGWVTTRPHRGREFYGHRCHSCHAREAKRIDEAMKTEAKPASPVNSSGRRAPIWYCTYCGDPIMRFARITDDDYHYLACPTCGAEVEGTGRYEDERTG